MNILENILMKIRKTKGGINDGQFGFSKPYEDILRADTKNKINEKNAGHH